MAAVRIATFNVNGIRRRLPHLLAWLERERPDIACLQELKSTDEMFPKAEIEAAGYGVRFQGQRSWNGVAILARGMEPIESRRGLPGEREDEQSRYIEAVAHGVIVGGLYLPNGNPQPGPKFDYKLRWFDRLIAHARTLLDTGHPVVLAGDFNVVPTDTLDVYNPKSWTRDALFQPESRAAWERLLAQGWTDALRTLHPDAKIFTFWDYFRQHWERDAGLRIDHLLLSPSLAPRLRAAGVDRWVRGLEGASDHAPTWIELDAAGLGAAPAARAPRMARASRTSATPRDVAGDAPTKKTGARGRPESKNARSEASPTRKTHTKPAPAKRAAKTAVKRATTRAAEAASKKAPAGKADNTSSTPSTTRTSTRRAAKTPRTR